MNTIYIGVDFHARQQTICYLTTETGELVTTALKHEPKTAVRTFYINKVGASASFPGQIFFNCAPLVFRHRWQIKRIDNVASTPPTSDPDLRSSTSTQKPCHIFS